MLSRIFKKSKATVLRPTATTGDETAARPLVDAIAHADRSKAATEMEGRIEAIRSALLSSDRPLAPWERPWLAASEELQERLALSDRSDATFQIEMSEAEAVRASKGPQWCRALLSLTRHLTPSTVLEMGTNVGISSLYITAGLELNGSGKLITLEGSGSKAELARANLLRLGFGRAEVVTGDFAETLEPSLGKLKPLELAFIDGFHEGSATVEYHRLCKANAATGAVFVYDDIDWSDGMRHAWREIIRDPDVRVALDYGSVGVCQLN